MADLLKDIMNMALIFGCSPSVGVPAQTQMMADIADTLLHGYNEEYTSTFPDVLDRLQGHDVNFEMVTSGTLRPFRFFYTYNVVTDTICFIFV